MCVCYMCLCAYTYKQMIHTYVFIYLSLQLSLSSLSLSLITNLSISIYIFRHSCKVRCQSREDLLSLTGHRAKQVHLRRCNEVTFLTLLLLLECWCKNLKQEQESQLAELEEHEKLCTTSRSFFFFFALRFINSEFLSHAAFFTGCRWASGGKLGSERSQLIHVRHDVHSDSFQLECERNPEW